MNLHACELLHFHREKFLSRRSRNRSRKQTCNDNNDCTVNGHVEGTTESKTKTKKKRGLYTCLIGRYTYSYFNHRYINISGKLYQDPETMKRIFYVFSFFFQ